MAALAFDQIPEVLLAERIWIQSEQGLADLDTKSFAQRHGLELFENFKSSSPWPAKTRGQVFVSTSAHPELVCDGPVLVVGQQAQMLSVEYCEWLIVTSRFDEFERVLVRKGYQMDVAHFEYSLLRARKLSLEGCDVEAGPLIQEIGRLDLSADQKIRWQIYSCLFDLVDRDLAQAQRLLAEMRERTDYFSQRPLMYAELMHSICVCADATRHSQGLANAQEAEAAFIRIGHKFGTIRARQFQVVALMSLGRVSEARALYLSAEVASRENGFKSFNATVAVHLVSSSLRQGQLIGLDRVIDSMQPTDDPTAQSRALYFLRLYKIDQLSLALKPLLDLQKNEQDKFDGRHIMEMLGDFKVGRTGVVGQTFELGFLGYRPTNVRILLVSVYLELSFQSQFATGLEPLFKDLQSQERNQFINVKSPYKFFEAAHWAELKNYARSLECLSECQLEFENDRQGLWAFRAALLEAQVLIALGNLRQASAALQLARRWEQVYSTIGLFRTELIVTEAALLVRQGRDGELASQWALDSKAKDVFEGRRGLDADDDDFKYLSGWFFSRMRRWMGEWGLDTAGQMTCITLGDELRLSRDDFEAWARKFKGLLLNEDLQRLYYKGRELKLGPDSVLYQILATLIRNPGVGIDKESLVVRCWKEPYNPLVHDARIYTAIRRIRSLSNDDLIVNSGRLYRLNPKITWGRGVKATGNNRSIDRYQSVLDYVRSNGSVTRQVIEQSLGLAATQSKKAIQTMLDQGLLMRINKGPATRYRLRF